MSLSCTSLVGVRAHQKVPWRAALFYPQSTWRGLGLSAEGEGTQNRQRSSPGCRGIRQDYGGWPVNTISRTEACSLLHPPTLSDFGLKYSILSVKMYKEWWDSRVCAGVIGIKGILQHFDTAWKIMLAIPHIGKKKTHTRYINIQCFSNTLENKDSKKGEGLQRCNRRTIFVPFSS